MFDNDDIANVKIFSDHFEASTPTGNSLPEKNSPVSQTRSGYSLRSHSRTILARRKLMGAASMFNVFNLPGLPWKSGNGDQEKVELTNLELESLRSEITALEEREAHMKARLEHLDEVLRSARLAGYLYIRHRWTALPGEPPIDDSDVDDWLPRFVVLHGSCIYLYLLSTVFSADLSPQDSTLLSDVVEVGPLPSFIQEDGQPRYLFHVVTRQGLKIECWSNSKIQVDSWLQALMADCKLGPATTSTKIN